LLVLLVLALLLVLLLLLLEGAYVVTPLPTNRARIRGAGKNEELKKARSWEKRNQMGE
jgi:hypothetical protein